MAYGFGGVVEQVWQQFQAQTVVLLPKVMGSVLEFGPVAAEPTTRLYISGDTLLYREIAEIPRRFPHLDAGIVHLGGTTLPGGLVVTLDDSPLEEVPEGFDPNELVVHQQDIQAFVNAMWAGVTQ